MTVRLRQKNTTGSTVFDRYRRRLTTGAIDSITKTTLSFTQRDEMTDVVVPKFKKLSAMGKLAFNPMEKKESSYHDLGASGTISNSTTGYAWVMPHYVQHIPTIDGLLSNTEFAALVARAESLAITEAYSKVGEATVTGLVELGELRETLTFLASPVKAMVRLTQRADRWLQAAKRREASYQSRLARYNERLERWNRRKRKGNAPVAPTKPKHPKFKVKGFSASTIPDFWLAYRYGIMPLIYSFQDIQKALKEMNEMRPERATARSNAQEQYTTDWVRASGSNASSPGGNFNYRYLTKVDVAISCRAGVLYNPEYSFANTWGLQLHQVPAAAYELIPLSFVADWFYTGSTAYQAITAHLRAQRILGAWVTTQANGTLTAEDTQTPVPPATGGGTFRSGMTTISWKRRRNVSLADVRVQVKVSLNAFRIADGLAIISGFFRKNGVR